MMSNVKVPQGVIPVLPTPFDEKDKLNINALNQLIEYIIENKVHWICVGGSTSEYTTMTLSERKQLLETAAKTIDGRVPMLASTGCHNLTQTMELTRFAVELGYEAILLLTPYHIYPGREATIEYYKTVAGAFPDTGFVIYNCPGLTGVTTPIEDITELAKLPNIVGIKYSVDPLLANYLIENTKMQGQVFETMTGRDAMLLVNIAQGGGGLISYLPTLLPKEMVRLYDLMVKENNWAEALKIDMRIRRLNTLLDSEPFPGPIKTALDLIGIPFGAPRLPVPPCSDGLKEKIREELKKLGYCV